MSPTEFCYWAQGYVELGGGPPTPEQWEVIKEHLNLVFTKVTEKTVAPASPGSTAKPPRPWDGKLCFSASDLIQSAGSAGPTYCLSTALDAMRAKEEVVPLFGAGGSNVYITC